MAGIFNSDARTLAIIGDVLQLPAETSWVEFKENNEDPNMIGKLISALSNAARFADKDFAYIIWGVRDNSKELIDTKFNPSSQKQNNQPLDLWLAQRLKPSLNFKFEPVEYLGSHLVLLTIPAASTSPIEYEGVAYCRIGSATPKLSDYPERLRALWTKLQPFSWEFGIAAQFLTGDEVLERLDYSAYFELTGQPLPDNRVGIFDKLLSDRLILNDAGGHWNITNLGALLFAKRLGDFSTSLERKGVRFVAYNGISRADAVTHRQDGQKGYAIGFKGLVEYIDSLLPRNEHIGKAFREEKPLYPSIAIRELIANALIHQDMTITGAGPLIEMFSDRMEITNPGQPLMDPKRFLDSPPRSRNEAIASLMRRMRICEEQGTGIDKVIVSVELHQMPPPDFRMESESVRAVLFAPRKFADMTPDERIRACYQHAALKYVTGQRMKNSTLCERFGIESHNSSQASLVIKNALKVGLIRVDDPDHPRAGYVPFWA